MEQGSGKAGATEVYEHHHDKSDAAAGASQARSNGLRPRAEMGAVNEGIHHCAEHRDITQALSADQ
jgi:hypothetical protein